MSQMKVYDIIKDLGGEATSSEIKLMAKEKYPNKTLYLYTANRLNLLKKNDIVKNKGDKWIIVDKNPDWTSGHKIKKFLGDK